MAGYSGTPLPKKLGIKDDSRVLAVGAPDGFAATLGVVVATRAAKTHDVVIVFATERKTLERHIVKLERSVFPDGALWAAWPKKASKVPTDITEDTVRDICLPRGLVDVKVCAIDDVWSGLKLVWRKQLRT